MSEIIKDNTIDVQDIVKNRNHGDIVSTDDGGFGIVIDHKVEEDARKPEDVRLIENMLSDHSSIIDDLENNRQVEALLISEADIKKDHETLMEFKNNPKLSEHYDAIKSLVDVADQWDISADGVAPIGSNEAIKFNKLINGDLVDEDNPLGINTEALKQNAIEEYNKLHEEKPEQKPEPVKPEVPAPTPTNTPEEGETTQFNVPEGEVRAFIDTLPSETVGKVARSKTIIVNEVKKKDVPTKVRKITDASQFKRVLGRKFRPESESITLPNSGFHATFKGSGALAMATIIPDRESDPVDYNKRYQFVYDNLIDTSIGKLSYTEFCSYTAVADLDLCIFAILKASDPDENTVTLECGEPTCKREYDVKYRLSELVDVDSFTEKTMTQVKKIIDNKDIFENAKKVFDESPMMQIKSVDITSDDNTTTTIDIKQPNGTVTIERAPVIPDIASQRNPYIASLILYIPSVSITVDEDGEQVTYEIDDPYSIAEILSELDDDCLQALTEILKGLDEYELPTYSFKGNFECPACHKREDHIPCNVNTLVFQKVSKAMR